MSSWVVSRGKMGRTSLILSFLILSSLFLTRCASTDTHIVRRQDADELFLRRQFPQAIERYQTLLRESPNAPNTAELNYRIGLCYLAMDNNKTALVYFQQAVETARDPALKVRAQERLGFVYFLQGNPVQSAQALGQVIFASPDLLDRAIERDERDKVLYRLGVSYLRAGEWVRGQQTLKRLVAEYPNGEKVEAAQKLLGFPEPKYFVQHNTFSSKTKADQNCAECARKGIAAFVKAVTVKGKMMHLVLSGGFNTWQEAVREVERLKTLGISAITLP